MKKSLQSRRFLTVDTDWSIEVHIIRVHKPAENANKRRRLTMDTVGCNKMNFLPFSLRGIDFRFKGSLWLVQKLLLVIAM